MVRMDHQSMVSLSRIKRNKDLREHFEMVFFVVVAACQAKMRIRTHGAAVQCHRTRQVSEQHLQNQREVAREEQQGQLKTLRCLQNLIVFDVHSAAVVAVVAVVAS